MHDDTYALGATDAEHERLIRQAETLAPHTKRFFREAGIGEGQRVLDLGSGVGDVAMLVARLVGPTGEVVGIERDPRSIARARARTADAGLKHVSFTQADAAQIKSDRLFDAAVGRFILQFIPDPVQVVRSLVELVRPGGVLAFHEVSWKPSLALTSHLPVWSALASVTRESLERSGGNTEMGIDVYRIFLEAGLPAPAMRLEVRLDNNPNFNMWLYDLFHTLLPRTQQHGISLAALGDLSTLRERVEAEAEASRSPIPSFGMVGAFSRRP